MDCSFTKTQYVAIDYEKFKIVQPCGFYVINASGSITHFHPDEEEEAQNYAEYANGPRPVYSIYSLDQINQTIKDVLELAAQKCEEVSETKGDADECAAEIRSMLNDLLK